MGKESDRLLREMEDLAEFDAKRPVVEAAMTRLEVYRHEYDRLIQDPVAFFKRNQTLFDEPAFETLRLTVSDLTRAFEAVGYPPSTRDTHYIDFMIRVVRFLFREDRHRRLGLTRRLACLIPDYVAQERYLDAWLIQHNFAALSDMSENGACPFMFCMVMCGLREWLKTCGAEERKFFKEIGFDPDERQRHGILGWEKALAALDTDEMHEAAKQFFEAHPHLHARAQEKSRAAEDAAVALLERDEGRFLLLDEEVVNPWVSLFEERSVADPAYKQLATMNEKQNRKAIGQIAEILYQTSGEMAESVFNQERLDWLKDTITARLKQLEGENSQEVLALTWALTSVLCGVQATENHFFTMLCLYSIKRVMSEA